MSRLLLRLLLCSIPSVALAQGATGGGNLTRQTSSDGSHRTDTLQWNQKKLSEYRIKDRITPKTAMSLLVTNFNYLRYQPVINTTTKTVEGYSDLEKLWSDALALGVSAPGKGGAVNALSVGSSPFIEALKKWHNSIVDEEQTLADVMAKVPKTVALSADDVTVIAKWKTTEDPVPEALDQKRTAVERLVYDVKAFVVETPIADAAPSVKPEPPKTGKDTAKAKPQLKLEKANETTPRPNDGGGVVQQGGKRDSTAKVTASPVSLSPNVEVYYARQLYDAELARHNALVEKIHTFSKVAGDVVNGKVTDLDPQKAGTIVTTSIRVQATTTTANEADLASKEGTTTVSYYVQSTMPLVFHAGPAYTNIAAFDVEKVSRPNVGDVYQLVNKPGSSPDLIAFMTYMLTPLAYDQPGFGLTLGTGVKDIGKRLYVGATAKFNEHLLLTGGAFTQSLKEGDVAFSSSSGLYTSIKNVQKWGWYGALSVAPF